MRLIALALALLISGSATAQVGQTVWLPITKPSSGGGGGSASCATATNTEVQTWGSNVDTQAGSAGAVSSTQCGNVDTLVTSLKTAVGTPLSSNVSRLWLATSADTTAGNIAAQFKVDVIHGSLLDFTNANIGARLVHTTGYTPNGTSEVIKTTFTPSTSDTSVYAVNSASFGVYILSAGAGTSNAIVLGGYDGANADQIVPFSPGASTRNTVTLHNLSVAGNSVATTVFGLMIGTLASSGTVLDSRQYQSASATDSTAIIGARTLPTVPIYLGARNNSGTTDSFSSDSQGAYFLARGLTGTEADNIAAALNVYMTSVGAAHW